MIVSVKELFMELGKLLRERRLALKYTTSSLAQKIGSHSGQVSNWENGKRTPTARYLVKLIVVLGISISDLKRIN